MTTKESPKVLKRSLDDSCIDIEHSRKRTKTQIKSYDPSAQENSSVTLEPFDSKLKTIKTVVRPLGSLRGMSL